MATETDLSSIKTERRSLNTSFLGRVSYQDGLDLQDRLARDLKDGGQDEHLLLLEHPPVLTLGRNASESNIVASANVLSAEGIEVHTCGRGGDVTYHGPGQLVGYPIMCLAPDQKDVGKYVRGLEEALIRTLAEFGIESGRIQGLTGVWVGNEKVAAIGVRISRWVTSHGFALNVHTNLDHFNTIIPCGIQNKGVTSMAKLLGSSPSLEKVGERFAPHFAEIFDRDLRWKETECHG